MPFNSREYAKAYYRAHRDKWKGYEANRNKDERNAYRKRVRSLEINRARERRHSMKYRGRYPEKAKAVAAVARAVKAGMLTRPKACQGCSVVTKYALHGHHWAGYDKPLVVMWLCRNCHSLCHGALKASKP